MKKEGLISQTQANAMKKKTSKTIMTDTEEVEVYKEIAEEIEKKKSREETVMKEGDFLDAFEIAVLKKEKEVCENSALVMIMVELDCDETKARACLETIRAKKEAAEEGKLKRYKRDFAERTSLQADGFDV
jgi:hypothetical protein